MPLSSWMQESWRSLESRQKWNIRGAELYGVGYSLKTIALLDNGNIQGLAVPDGYEIGYKSVEEITKRIEHRSYKMQGYITEYQVLGRKFLYGRRFRKVFIFL